MPTRDEQEYEARRQQIIDAALQVFSAEGFERATNKDVARAARIKSPGLIYHYFKDKTDLFAAVIEERAPALQMILHGEEYMERLPRETLMAFATSFVLTMDNRSAMLLFKMVLGEGLRRPAVADMFNKVAPLRGFAFLTRYLEHHMELGHLRRMDVGAAARCFIGPLLAYVITREVFVQPDAHSLQPQVMASTAVDIFLGGMETPGTP